MLELMQDRRSFDLAETWRYIKNLPLTQFYKVAVIMQTHYIIIVGVLKITEQPEDLQQLMKEKEYLLSIGIRLWVLMDTNLLLIQYTMTLYTVNFS